MVSSRHPSPGLRALSLASAAAAAAVFLALFHLGRYDGYNAWPTRYHFPDALRVGPGGLSRFEAFRFLAFAAATPAAMATAAALILARFAGAGSGPGSMASILACLSRAVWPFHFLWLLPASYLLGGAPNMAWLFAFIFWTSLSALLLGLFWPGRPRPVSSASQDAASRPGDQAPDALPPPSRKTIAILAAGCIAFILLFSILTILQYHAGNLGYADSGFVAEALWNTLHGRFLYAHGFHPPMLLADHFSPIWLALLPFYALVPRHETLIVASAVAIALAAVPLFVLARREWKDDRSALCLAIAFLLFPGAQHEVSSYSYGFQAEVVAIPFLAWSCSSLRQKKWKSFWLALLLTLACKETLTAVVFGIGLCLGVLQGDWRRGLAVMAIAVAWLFAVTKCLIPWLKGGAGDYYQLTHFYGHLGGSFSDILATIFKQIATAPIDTARNLFHREVWMFLAQMLLPLALLSLLSPAALLMAFPNFFMMLFSQKPHFFSIFHHYKDALVVVPFFAAAIGVRFAFEGRGWAGSLIARLRPEAGARRAAVLCAVSLGLLAASFLHAYYFGPTPLSKTFESKLVTLTPKSLALARMKDRIGLDASVATTHRAGAHFTDRRQLYVLRLPATLRPDIIYEADYILLDTNDPWGDPKNELVPPILETLRKRPDFRLVARESTFVLYQKTGKEKPP